MKAKTKIKLKKINEYLDSIEKPVSKLYIQQKFKLDYYTINQFLDGHPKVIVRKSKKEKEKIIADLVEENPIITNSEIANLTSLNPATVSITRKSLGIGRTNTINRIIDKTLEDIEIISISSLAKKIGISYSYASEYAKNHPKIVTSAVYNEFVLKKILKNLKDEISYDKLISLSAEYSIRYTVLRRAVGKLDIVINGDPSAHIGKEYRKTEKKERGYPEKDPLSFNEKVRRKSSKLRMAKLIHAFLKHENGLRIAEVAEILGYDRDVARGYITIIRDAGFDIENSGSPNYIYKMYLNNPK